MTDVFAKGFLVGVLVLFGVALGLNSALATDDLEVTVDGKPLNEVVLFHNSNFAPGESITRSIKIKNNSPLERGVGCRVENNENFSDPGGLAEVLDVTIEKKGTLLYGPKTFSEFKKGEVYLLSLQPGEEVDLDVTIRFRDTNNNKYQGKALTFDFTIGFEALPTSVNTSLRVSPGIGGILKQESPDKKIALEIAVPKDAFDKEVEIFAILHLKDSVSAPALDSGAVIIGDYVFDIFVKDLNGNNVTTFKKPIFLTFYYSPSIIPSGINEDSLRIYYFDQYLKNWMGLLTSINDIDQWVRTKIDHLTLFAVLGGKTSEEVLLTSQVEQATSPSETRRVLISEEETKEERKELPSLVEEVSPKEESKPEVSSEPEKTSPVTPKEARTPSSRVPSPGEKTQPGFWSRLGAAAGNIPVSSWILVGISLIALIAIFILKRQT